MTVWLSCSIAVPLVVSTDNFCQITVSRDFSDDSMADLPWCSAPGGPHRQFMSDAGLQGFLS